MYKNTLILPQKSGCTEVFKYFCKYYVVLQIEVKNSNFQLWIIFADVFESLVSK